MGKIHFESKLLFFCLRVQTKDADICFLNLSFDIKIQIVEFNLVLSLTAAGYFCWSDVILNYASSPYKITVN